MWLPRDYRRTEASLHFRMAKAALPYTHDTAGIGAAAVAVVNIVSLRTTTQRAVVWARSEIFARYGCYLWRDGKTNAWARRALAELLVAEATSHRLGGWPRWPALAAATALHAAIIAGAMLDWPKPEAAPPTDHMPIRLVVAGPPMPEAEPPAPPEKDPENSMGELASPEALSPTASDLAEYAIPSPPSPAPSVESAVGDPLPPPPRAKPKAYLPRKGRAAIPTEQPKDTPSSASGPTLTGVAVYRVFVAANGDIRSITLTQSSGTKVFDEAGIEVVRNTIFEAQAQGQSAETTGSFEVTLHFSPDTR